MCALLLLFVLGVKLDVTGYERRVPEPEQIESVWVNGDEFRQPENLQAAVELHRSLLANRARHEPKSRDVVTVGIRYTLKDGSQLSRYYQVSYDTEDPDPDLLLAARLLDSDEAIASRMRTILPVEPRYIEHAQLAFQPLTEERWSNDYRSLTLTGKQAASLFREGILADAAEHTIGRGQFADLLPDGLTPSGYTFDLVLTDSTDPFDPGEGDTYDYLSYTIYLESAHTLAWIRENTNF